MLTSEEIREIAKRTVEELYRKYNLPSEDFPRIDIDDGNEILNKIKKIGVGVASVVISSEKTSISFGEYIFPSYSHLSFLLKQAFPYVKFEIGDGEDVHLYFCEESEPSKILKLEGPTGLCFDKVERDKIYYLKKLPIYLPFSQIPKIPPKSYLLLSNSFSFIITNNGVVALPFAQTFPEGIVFYHVENTYYDKSLSITLNNEEIKCITFHEVIGHYLPQRGIELEPYTLCKNSVENYIKLGKIDKEFAKAYKEEIIAECSACVESKECIPVLKNLRNRVKEKRSKLYNKYVKFSSIFSDKLNEFSKRLLNKKLYIEDALSRFDSVNFHRGFVENYLIGIEIAEKIRN